MRTSRLAQDTARLTVALASARRRTRANGANIDAVAVDEGIADVKADASSGSNMDADTSGLSSPLSSPPQELELELEDAVGGAELSRKRKRGQNPTAVESTSPPHRAMPTFPSESTPKSSRATLTRTAPVKAVSMPLSAFPRKARRQPAKRVRSSTSATSGPANAESVAHVEPPPNWEEMYALTQEMRALWPAPVDTMGCERLAEDERAPEVKRFQTLVALMLSSQTKDTVTAAAMRRLQEELPGGLTLPSILAVSDTDLNNLISKVGFHNTKTKHIKAAAQILADRFNGDIPATAADLISLPGVGPKMAYLTLSAAWGRDEGIGVDVHVHRITNLWGWHRTRAPEETRKALEAWLPRDRWHDINTLLVGFGQTWCPPVGRRCGECRLAERGLCPSAVVERRARKVEKGRRNGSGGGGVGVSVQDGLGDGSYAVTKGEDDEVTKDGDIKIEVDVEPVNEEEVLGPEGKAELLLAQDMEDIAQPAHRPMRARASKRRGNMAI